jgi:hypothetical protein
LRREKQENYAPIFQRRNLQQPAIKVESRQNLSNIFKCRLILANFEAEISKLRINRVNKTNVANRKSRKTCDRRTKVFRFANSKSKHGNRQK